ncbi:MAG: hypothetical protein KKC79_01805 [Gammaproteobacteria bacterium]|nr:hypothetical protein [Gammaproteobacteria bacterium]MBU1441782.1 hypothetical protein [Gammaproteobacteria bacterium]MBU2288790.1 hypothetical protein [Gammaproteobacteria bacterium]MBU2407365.1 hypothetical protein [Gammaproteobacteria bacterium]
MNEDDPTQRPDALLHGETLQESIDRLRAIARAMDDLQSRDMTVEQLQLTARHQARIRSLAAELVVRQVELLTGDARINGAEVNAAVRYAEQSIAEVRNVRALLAKAATLIEFVGVVLTGDHLAIVHAAFHMRSSL